VAEVEGLEQPAGLPVVALAGIASDGRSELMRMPTAFDHVSAEVEHLIHARLVAAVEQERAHIARELHDVVGQALTAVRLNLLSLDAPRRRGTGRGARIDSSLAAVDAAIDQVRTVAFELRPGVLDDLGLAAALRALCRSTGTRASVRISCRTDLGPIRLPPDVETTCFRIVQEALTNAIRHAGARRISVRVAVRGRPRVLVLEVVDDGAGFDPTICTSGRCIGIRGMRERASIAGGTVEVQSAPGRGTMVRSQLPAGWGGA
jgi:signal transduction histidine kinase